jgi:cytochrome c oxidase assembly factor CtaG
VIALSGWHFDPAVAASCALAVAAYAAGTQRYQLLRGRSWPASRSAWFNLAILTAIIAIESPLDAAGDVRFSPHMLQHLVLTDVTAPLLLLGAPLLLVLSATPTAFARRIVNLLKSPLGKTLAFPPFTWSVFILSLWILHFTGFFEATLTNGWIHILEHAIFISAALLFWFPVISIGPTPWSHGPLAYPLRMLYLFVAMPAEGMLGFAINGARHVLYPSYAAGGLDDQRAAGELMWIGGTLAMFVAFMVVGFEWAKYEQRVGLKHDRDAA